MRRTVLILPFAFASACTMPGGSYPSLAARPAEAIDPRLPIASDPAPGTVDPALATALAGLVSDARGGVGRFETLAADAEHLAASAGAGQSESWVVAQQALSALVAQHGITTRAAADVDALAATRIDASRWLAPARQAAIRAAAADIGAINDRQVATISRLTERLGR